MVDGTFYFDEEQDAKMKEQIDSERNRIIANILRETPQPATFNNSKFSKTMKNKIYISVILIVACLFQVTAQSPVVAPAQKKPVMLVGGTIHTGTGDVIENGTISICWRKDYCSWKII